MEIQLHGSEANVLLMDNSDFSSFRSNGSYRNAVGGTWKRSPVYLTVPRAGHWYGVVYIPFGYTGRVKAGFRVMPRQQLPPIRQTYNSASLLGSIRQAADEYTESIGIDPADKAFDVFISHANEDKPEVVRPLAEALRSRGVSVWYDEFELRIGDSLRRKIDQGIRTSRFGVVVLSPSFFEKGWTNYELDGLVTIGVTRARPVILPVWHNVTHADVAGYSPSLAALIARSTDSVTIDSLADEIAGVVRPAGEPTLT